MMLFGERLKNLREQKNITREELAKDTCVSYWALSKYETNDREPDFETLKRFASYFEVSVDYLLGRTNIKSPIETIAFHRTDDPMSDLPEDARKSVEEFIAFVKKKYGQDEKTK